METSFLSFILVKLKQIHIDKGITADYSTNIPQCAGILYNFNHRFTGDPIGSLFTMSCYVLQNLSSQAYVMHP